MDKQNYTLRELEIQVIKENFSLLKANLTKELEAQIFKRKRILDSMELLLKAIFLYITEQLSFQRLSDRMACQYGVVMSDTAWRKQLLKAAPILMEWVLEQQGLKVAQSSDETVLGCSRAYAIDATNLSVQGGKTTSRRIHTMFSIQKHCCVYTEVTDCHGGERLTRFPLQPGALYFADRAYGKAPQILFAIEQQAHVVTRISPNLITFYTAPDCKEKVSIPSLLQGESFSSVVYLKPGKKGTGCPIRLLGAKLPEETQVEAEKRVRRKASRNQYQVSEDTIHYTHWIFLVTTLPDTTCSDAEIVQAYRLRWQIELHFKRIKSLLHFHKLRRSCQTYQTGIVSLWLTLSFFVSSLQLSILSCSNFSLSDFNAFSLAKSFFL